MKQFILRFKDEQLHEDFKIACIKNKSNMQQELTKMIKEYLEKESKR